MDSALFYGDDVVDCDGEGVGPRWGDRIEWVQAEATHGTISS